MRNDAHDLKRRIGALERALPAAHVDASLAVDSQSKDPAGSMSKAGRALETLLGDILRRETGSLPPGLTIDQLRSRVQAEVPDMPSTIRPHIDHVRSLRNVGAHGNVTGSISPEDARVGLLTFARIAEWYIEKYVDPIEAKPGFGEGTEDLDRIGVFRESAQAGDPPDDAGVHSAKEPGDEGLVRRQRRNSGAAVRRMLAVVSASALVAIITSAVFFVWLIRSLRLE